MKRQLPLVTIEGTGFYVDVMHEDLWEKGNPENRISFNVFEQDRNGYTFLYDKKRKNIPDPGVEHEKMEEHFVWVTLPALMELDAEGIALKYNIPLSILCPELAVNDNDDDDDYEEDLY